jgi:putative restriction endonuclease
VLEVGQKYTRKQVQQVVGAPIVQGGDWATGYTEFDGKIYLFCNVGAAGRTGHDYANRWVGDHLLSQGKSNSVRGQSQIERMIASVTPVHVFYRDGDRKPFIYAGVGKAESVGGARPVTIEWSFTKGRPSEPLTADEIADELQKLEFTLDPATVKSQRAFSNGLIVYLKRDSKAAPLVIGPEWQDQLSELLKIKGVWRTKKDDFFYHQSMLLGFPSRQHTGKRETHYGIDFELNSREAVRLLVTFLKDWVTRPSQPQSTISSIVDPQTETESRRAARLGQTKFRNELLSRWSGCCALTGFAMPEMIRASHIKPWCKANDRERLDPDNGLPLLIQIDLLFDKGFISFDDNGLIIISKSLDAAHCAVLGVRNGMKIGQLTEGNRSYLVYHRTKILHSNSDGARTL